MLIAGKHVCTHRGLSSKYFAVSQENEAQRGQFIHPVAHSKRRWRSILGLGEMIDQQHVQGFVWAVPLPKCCSHTHW